MNPVKIPFLILSFFIAIWLISAGSWLAILAIIIYTLWLTAPILIAKKDELKISMLQYIVWVVIQILIYRWGIGPPEGIGIPHF